MNPLSLLAAASLMAATAAATAHDHAPAHGHASATATSPASTPAAADARGEGEVRKLDRAAGRLTLSHGPIASIGMPAMTMVFRVGDAGLLDGLAVGHKVRFTTRRIDGAYTVTSLEPIR